MEPTMPTSVVAIRASLWHRDGDMAICTIT